MRIRSVAVSIVILTLALPSAGCWDTKASAITGPVTVTFWHSQSGAALEELEALVAAFSVVERDITVKLVPAGTPAEAADRLAEVLATGEGEAPAVVEVPATDLGRLRAADAIRPLGDLATNRTYGLELGDVEDFWPVLIEANTVDREIYGLPFMVRLYALVYDPTEVAQPPTGWTGLAETAAALTRRSADPAQSVFGLALRSDASAFMILLHQHGGRLLDGDPPRLAFNDQAGVAALDVLYEMVALRRCVLLTVGDPVRAVADGRAAMAITAVGSVPTDVQGGALSVAPLPVAVHNASLAPSTSLVLASGRDPAVTEAGWRLMRWLTSRENTARWAPAAGCIPARRSALDAAPWRDGFGRDPAWRSVVAQMETAVAIPEVAAWREVEQELTTAVSTCLLGQTNSLKLVLDRAAERANRSLTGP